MLLRQFFDAPSATLTYLLASSEGREAVIIDPVKNQVARYLEVIEALGLRLVKAIDTHTHADHVTGIGALRSSTQCASVMGALTRTQCISEPIDEGESINAGGLSLRAIHTPGHTDDSYSFVLEDGGPPAVFTGDVLLIGGSGRTDLQGGDPGQSWASITERLFSLADPTIVYPAHDYRGRTSSTIGEERRSNPRLAGKTRAQYISLMNSLHLPAPAMLDLALRANRACGDERAADSSS